MRAAFALPFAAFAAAFGLYCLVNYPIAVILAAAFFFLFNRN